MAPRPGARKDSPEQTRLICKPTCSSMLVSWFAAILWMERILHRFQIMRTHGFWYLQGNHHSRDSEVVQDFLHPQYQRLWTCSMNLGIRLKETTRVGEVSLPHFKGSFPPSLLTTGYTRSTHTPAFIASVLPAAQENALHLNVGSSAFRGFVLNYWQISPSQFPNLSSAMARIGPIRQSTSHLRRSM